MVNKVRILGDKLMDERVVEKILVSLPKRFETKIFFLEDLRDFC